jgi:hypothetical protein
MNKIFVGLLFLTSVSSFASVSCLNSPIEELTDIAKTSEIKYVKSFFSKQPQAEWFTKTDNFKWIYSARTKYLEAQPYKKLQDDFLTMVQIKTAEENAKNPSLEQFESYEEVMKKILSSDANNDSTAGNGFIKDFLDYTDEISIHRIGSDVFGFESVPYEEIAIMREINKLQESELCDKNGKLISKKKFVELVRSKLSDTDKKVQQ